MCGDNFTSSFSVWMTFISFSCLVARSSSTMLNGSGEDRLPCLVPDLKGKAFRFSLLIMMLAVSFMYMAFIVLQ
jgi:hypothetical protein